MSVVQRIFSDHNGERDLTNDEYVEITIGHILFRQGTTDPERTYRKMEPFSLHTVATDRVLHFSSPYDFYLFLEDAWKTRQQELDTANGSC